MSKVLLAQLICRQACYVYTYDLYQLFEGKQRLPTLPLDPILVQAPFQQWGLDFIGQFHHICSDGFNWILIAIDYFTKWVEAIPLKTSSNTTIVRFLEENIITQFGVPSKITNGNASVFRLTELMAFFSRYNITLPHSVN